MPTLAGYLLLFVMVLGLAALLRWSYWIWLALIGGAMAVVGAAFVVAGAQVPPTPEAPSYAAQVREELQAFSWPKEREEIARLIFAFRLLGDVETADTLSWAYRLEVARGFLGETPARFAGPLTMTNGPDRSKSKRSAGCIERRC